MSEHYSLGVGAGAAGIEQFGKGVFVELQDVWLMGRCLREHVVIIVGRKPRLLRDGVEQEKVLNQRNAFSE